MTHLVQKIWESFSSQNPFSQKALVAGPLNKELFLRLPLNITDFEKDLILPL